ncbi:MAG: hypothetical protein KJS91_06005, partial [Planctomycetes bacterium]|nr:hypothetical protein [Planctomycetota bacterium]
MKRFSWLGIFSRLGSVLRPFRSVRRARLGRAQLNIEALEGRLVPAAVAPGAVWYDGYDDAQGQRLGVTVTLKNEGSTWLEVGGGGGAVTVAPGTPPSGSGGSSSSLSVELSPDGGNGTGGSSVPVVPAYAFSVTGLQGDGSGDVTWSGAAESLYITATGDVSSLAISGDLFVRAGWTIGDLSARTVSARAGQSIGNVNASDDVGELSAGTTIGMVTATDAIGVVMAGTSVADVSAGGNITSISAGTNTKAVNAGGWLGSVIAGLDVGGTVSAGLWIGGAYLPDAGPDDNQAWQYVTYGGGVSAGRDVTSAVSASRGIVGVKAGRNVVGSISASGGDIWWVTAGGGGVQTPATNPDPSLNAESGGWTPYAPGNISGNVQASRDIHAISATGDVQGNVSAQGGFVRGVNAGGQITGNVSAGTDVGGFQLRQLDDAWHPFDWWMYFNGS